MATTNIPSIDELNQMTRRDALDVIARLIDQATDLGDVSLAEGALALADSLEARNLEAADLALLDYFRANAWSCRYQARVNARHDLWAFEQQELLHQILFLRKAAHAPAFKDLPAIRRCQILTNLANQFDSVGRCIEARMFWSLALAIDADFWMARGNRGRGLMYYAAALYDTGHKCFFASQAHHDLIEAAAVAQAQPHQGSLELAAVFREKAAEIAEHFDLAVIRERLVDREWPIGKTATEARYRTWCLENVLFLNPLNDVCRTSIAAHDVLVLPRFSTPLGKPPIIVGMYNELKQQYASARWFLWSGIHREKAHFSDRDVVLLNTLDYPCHGLGIEQVKTAFRMTYSVFDKIAFFLNFYLDLGDDLRGITFRTIWRDRRNQPVRKALDELENWPLRGLYWMSKDLFDEASREFAEPEARELAELRNHLEHRHIVVHEGSAEPIFMASQAPGYPYRVSRKTLEGKTLRLLQLARAGLVYLSLAVHCQERRRKPAGGGLGATINLDTWPDAWKR